jgi:hypothetical protein
MPAPIGVAIARRSFCSARTRPKPNEVRWSGLSESTMIARLLLTRLTVVMS